MDGHNLISFRWELIWALPCAKLVETVEIGNDNRRIQSDTL